MNCERLTDANLQRKIYKVGQYQIMYFQCFTARLRFPKNSACIDTVAEKTVNKTRLLSLLQNTYIDSQVFSVQNLQQEEFVVLLQERETAEEAGKLPSCFASILSGGVIAG